MNRADTENVKVVILQGQIVYKIGKYGKEIGGKTGKLSTKSGKRLSHSQY